MAEGFRDGAQHLETPSPHTLGKHFTFLGLHWPICQTGTRWYLLRMLGGPDEVMRERPMMPSIQFSFGQCWPPLEDLGEAF